MQYRKEPKHLTNKNIQLYFAKSICAAIVILLTSACSLTSTELANNKINTVDTKGDEQADNALALIHPSEVVEVALPEPDILETDPENPIPEDLWKYVAQQLELETPQNEPRFEEKKQWYLKHPNYMRTITQRARPFLYYIVEQFEAEDIPLDIVLLPIVESAFDPNAYSASGAVGMWQFMPATGKSFNMPQTFWYDGRKDVIASTLGAIDYLQYLYKMFDGNWLHALAAYNSGEGRVRSAIRKNRRAGRSTEFWSLDLPRETRAYVPRLLALADILRNRDALKYDWPKINNAPVIEVVDVGSQIDLNIAAKFADISEKELRALNPGFKEWATDPAGKHQLLLPTDKTEGFLLALSDLPENERLVWHRHQVKSGDSIGKLAQRYNTSITALKRINNLSSNTIYIGDILLTPTASNSATNADDAGIQAHIQGTVTISNTPKSENTPNKQYYTVSSGDTLSEIAQIFDVSVRELARWNDISSRTTLSIGRRLTILTDSSSLADTKELTYKVRSGDSLSEIAQQFNIRVTDILRWNAISKREILQIGQPLKLLLTI